MALILAAQRRLPPDDLGIAYKEWAGICRALRSGQQTVLLRKGGIAESGGEFRPEYSAFWLYPTYLHQAQQGLRATALEAVAPPLEGMVELELVALVERVTRLDREEDLCRLDEFHVWTEETVRSRFHYRSPGLWILGVRIYRRTPAWQIAVTPDHAGCKTWVPLENALPVDHLTPVLSDDAAARRSTDLASALMFNVDITK